MSHLTHSTEIKLEKMQDYDYDLQPKIHFLPPRFALFCMIYYKSYHQYMLDTAFPIASFYGFDSKILSSSNFVKSIRLSFRGNDHCFYGYYGQPIVTSTCLLYEVFDKFPKILHQTHEHFVSKLL